MQARDTGPGACALLVEAAELIMWAHDLRKIAEDAKNDLREGLGPEFTDFEIEDLSPKRFMRKHLSGDLNADQRAQQQPARQTAANGTPRTPGERPPFDPDAT